MSETKPFSIDRQWVYDAYLKVKSNRGSGGVDGISLSMFDKAYKNHLYKLWNQMSSGSYLPPPVKLMEIPKKGGGLRPLGIPTIADRIGQTVVRGLLDPVLEFLFHEDSYGYRVGKSALDAVAKARERCWKQSWVVDLDIKGFFDNIPHELLMKAVKALRQQMDAIVHRKMVGSAFAIIRRNNSSKDQRRTAGLCHWACAGQFILALLHV